MSDSRFEIIGYLAMLPINYRVNIMKHANQYFYNGNRINAREAELVFTHFAINTLFMSEGDIDQAWNDCQYEEDSRDIYLPSGLEIVQS